MSRTIFWPVISIIGLTLLPLLVFSGRILAQPSATIMYGVHDAAGRDSQFFRLDLNSSTLVALGPLYDDYDVEAMDIHPATRVLYAIAGGGGNQDGNLFVVDKSTGDLTLIGNTGTGGSDEIVSASFHPDGTLWAFQQHVGLLTVNLADASTTLQWPVQGQNIGDNWEGLAWDLTGEFLYGSQGSKLYRWDPISQTAVRLCGSRLLPWRTEALAFRPDGVLIGAWHNAPVSALSVFEIDFDTCTIAPTDHDIPYNDVEGIAFETVALPTPTPPPPTGTDKLMAQVYIDFGCDGSFQNGVDIPLSNIPVTLCFPDGSGRTLETASRGVVTFAGFDASGGVTVSVDLPAEYRSYAVRRCFNSPTEIRLSSDDFQAGVIRHARVQFRTELLSETTHP